MWRLRCCEKKFGLDRELDHAIAAVLSETTSTCTVCLRAGSAIEGPQRQMASAMAKCSLTLMVNLSNCGCFVDDVS